MRQNEAGSIRATCFKISTRTSDGTLAIGHGGGGVFSIRGSACGIGKLAKERISSGVDSGLLSSCATGASLAAERFASLEGGALDEGKCFLR